MGGLSMGVVDRAAEDLKKDLKGKFMGSRYA